MKHILILTVIAAAGIITTPALAADEDNARWKRDDGSRSRRSG